MSNVLADIDIKNDFSSYQFIELWLKTGDFTRTSKLLLCMAIFW